VSVIKRYNGHLGMGFLTPNEESGIIPSTSKTSRFMFPGDPSGTLAVAFPHSSMLQ